MEGEQEAWRGQGCELPANHHQLITFTGSPAEGSAEGSGGRTITGDLLRGPAQRGAESPAHHLPGNDRAGPPAPQTQTLCSGLCGITGLTCVGACPHGLLGGAPTHGVCPPPSQMPASVATSAIRMLALGTEATAAQGLQQHLGSHQPIPPRYNDQGFKNGVQKWA